MYNKEEILSFIKRFQNEGTIKTFTQGCCYWFAKILDERFNFLKSESEIFYNDVDNHFATRIGNNLYDITGDLGDIKNILDSKKWSRWEYYCIYGDELVVERIFRDCIDF